MVLKLNRLRFAARFFRLVGDSRCSEKLSAQIESIKWRPPFFGSSSLVLFLQISSAVSDCRVLAACLEISKSVNLVDSSGYSDTLTNISTLTSRSRSSPHT
jgi:hypothetical protein